jgi:hypothetical protein
MNSLLVTWFKWDLKQYFSNLQRWFYQIQCFLAKFSLLITCLFYKTIDKNQ